MQSLEMGVRGVLLLPDGVSSKEAELRNGRRPERLGILVTVNEVLSEAESKTNPTSAC